jgi:2-iminobutanoate/2-iminopropanoate deaminase
MRHEGVFVRKIIHNYIERRLFIMKKVIATDQAPAAIGPYSQAIEVGNLVFTSGVIPVDPATGEIPEGSKAQAKQAFTNLKNLVEASGTTMDKVIKTVVFIKEMNDFGEINEVYAQFFPQPYPARSCVEVARLPKDVLLEVEAIVEK